MTTLFLLLSVYFSQPDAPVEKAPATAGTTTAVPDPQTATSQPSHWQILKVDANGKVLVLYFNEKNELVKKEWRSVEDVNTNKARVVRSLKRSLHEALKIQNEEYLN